MANQLPPLAFVVAGMLLLLGHPMGMYWTVPGTLLSFTAGLFGVWILIYRNPALVRTAVKQ